MSSLNKAMIIGNLGKDPELKYMPNGKAVASFSIATSQKWKDNDGNQQEKTEWHNVTAFEKLAEIVGEYVKKGSKVYIEGRLQTDQWEKDGVKHYSTKIIASQMVMLGGKTEKNETEAQPSSQQEAPKDDDLPFVWLLPLIPMLGGASERMFQVFS